MGKIQLRRDSATNWNASNPVLDSGEIGHDTTNGTYKFGNGVSSWKALPSIPVYNNSSWSVSDNFDRANGALAGPDYVAFCEFNVTEPPTINANQVKRPGSPSAADWNDGTIRLSDSKSLSHFAQINVATLSNGTETACWDGAPAATVMVRAIPFVPQDGSYFYNMQGDATLDLASVLKPALFAGIKLNQWMVWVAVPGTKSDSAWGTNRVFNRNARLIARGTGTYTGAGVLRLEITGEDTATVKYKGGTLWSGSVIDCPRGTYVGFSPGGANNAVGNFSGGLVTS